MPTLVQAARRPTLRSEYCARVLSVTALLLLLALLLPAAARAADLPAYGNGDDFEPQRCKAAYGVLCLNEGRFEVDVAWQDFDGNRDYGGAEGLSEQGGFFWFTERENPEIFVKVLDGCGSNGSFWVSVAGLTNLGVTVKVTDLHTGEEREYNNPLGRTFHTVFDTEAFDGCESADS